MRLLLERWKPVVGYEGLYEISDQGRVSSCEKSDSRGHKRKRKILRPHWVYGQSSRYLRIGLNRPGERQRKHLVHRLVLEAFVGPCPDGFESRHYPDHDTANNALANLSWTTRSQNARDQIERGTFNFPDWRLRLPENRA